MRGTQLSVCIKGDDGRHQRVVAGVGTAAGRRARGITKGWVGR